MYVLAIWCRVAPMGANMAAYAHAYTSIHMYMHTSVYAIMLAKIDMGTSSHA